MSICCFAQAAASHTETLRLESNPLLLLPPPHVPQPQPPRPSSNRTVDFTPTPFCGESAASNILSLTRIENEKVCFLARAAPPAGLEQIELESPSVGSPGCFPGFTSRCRIGSASKEIVSRSRRSHLPPIWANLLLPV
uniref:Uncharacterized protein n=1 Tax=Knipowitschia caucasica TaxID=637954 RepID=A0AAV2MGQ6_KNICA